jgi:phosphatidylglycerol:prolipoprotein diacylglycerol transferase
MRITRLGVELGSLTIGTFGLIVVLAAITGTLVARWQAKRRGLEPGVIGGFLPLMVIGGLVGARLFYICNPPPSVQATYSRGWYLAHPFDLQIGPLAVWSGGLGMAGALFGGCLGMIVGLWRQQQRVTQWAVTLVQGLMAALVISPWANVALQQLYGPPTALPWGMPVNAPVAPFEHVPPGTRFHPTPAYLSLWALVVLGVTLFVEKRYASRLSEVERAGLPALLCLLGVFLAEYLRVDVNHGWLGLTGMQALVLLLSGALVLVIARGRRLGAEREGS